MGFFSKACNNGTYGQGCKNQCGHCRDQNECHNVYGSCLTGCEDGYRGEMCNSSKVCSKRDTKNYQELEQIAEM